MRVKHALLCTVTAVSMMAQGCTVIGLVAGAATPVRERIERIENVAELEHGETLRVTSHVDAQKVITSGKFAGLKEGEGAAPAALRLNVREHWSPDGTLKHKTGEWSVPLQNVSLVEHQVGSHWDTGLGIGVAIDLTVLLGFGIYFVAECGGGDCY